MNNENNMMQPISPHWLMTRRSFLLVSLALLNGCGNGSGGKDSPSRDTGAASSGTATVATFDISASAHTEIVKKRYLDGFEQVLAAVHEGDRVEGYPITSITQSMSMDRIRAKFPVSKGLLDNPETYKARFAQARRNAVNQAREVLKLPTAGSTDILNAFTDAAGILDGCTGMNRHLVVFSDMVHQSSDYDFTREDLTPSRTKVIIQAQRKAGLLPSLAGVKVWVAGAGANPTDPNGDPSDAALASQRFVLPPGKIAQIRNFWISFFDACGADLSSDRYSATLQNYPG